MSKPSKNHHYVTRAQLRRFSIDSKEKQAWVFDKESERTWPSGIGAAGSENNFNTVEHETGKWNFEDLFNDVDGRFARLIRDTVGARSLAWLQAEDHIALLDLFATQMLRTIWRAHHLGCLPNSCETWYASLATIPTRPQE